MNLNFYQFYTFQHRKVSESPWGAPLEPLQPVKDKEWSFSSWDHFGHVFHRLNGRGDEWVFPGGKEPHDVWSKTSCKGYWSLKYAKGALKRLQEANDKGVWDCRSSYGHHEQAARYEFRIVKVTKFDKIVEVIP